MRMLHVLPFDSVRKRMSVMVEHPINHQIILYTKGADSAIFSNLKTKTGECLRALNEQEMFLLLRSGRAGPLQSLQNSRA